MKFNFRVIWYNPTKGRQQSVDAEQNHAIFIAKKKLSEGMQDVVIQVLSDYGDNPNDPTWPAIDIN